LDKNAKKPRKIREKVEKKPENKGAGGLWNKARRRKISFRSSRLPQKRQSKRNITSLQPFFLLSGRSKRRPGEFPPNRAVWRIKKVPFPARG